MIPIPDKYGGDYSRFWDDVLYTDEGKYWGSWSDWDKYTWAVSRIDLSRMYMSDCELQEWERVKPDAASRIWDWEKLSVVMEFHSKLKSKSLTPNWKCEPGQTGYEIDGCGNRRENPACAYREAELILCEWPAGTVIAGETYRAVVTVNQGSTTENYKLVFSGDYTGESSPFTVNAGTGQQQFNFDIIFATGGQKTVTATLLKV